MRIIYMDIDARRPDHLGCYDYHRNTSPALDATAAEGVRFNRCYASDWKKPAGPKAPLRRAKNTLPSCRALHPLARFFTPMDFGPPYHPSPPGQ